MKGEDQQVVMKEAIVDMLQSLHQMIDNYEQSLQDYKAKLLHIIAEKQQ